MIVDHLRQRLKAARSENRLERVRVLRVGLLACASRGTLLAHNRPGDHTGGGERVSIGKGSTGEVYSQDGKAYKSSTLKNGEKSPEGEVYSKLSGKPGISEGREVDGEIETPLYKNVVSVDAIPESRRNSFGPMVVKNKDDLYSAISELSNAGYDYNDPIQVGFDSDKQAKLFDFSNVNQTSVDDALRANSGHLQTYMEQFGASGEARRLSTTATLFTDMRTHIRDGVESDWLDERTQPHIDKLSSQLNGEIPRVAYYATNARHIGLSGIAQTEPVNGMKVILAPREVSETDAKQWEMTKVFSVER